MKISQLYRRQIIGGSLSHCFLILKQRVRGFSPDLIKLSRIPPGGTLQHTRPLRWYFQ